MEQVKVQVCSDITQGEIGFGAITNPNANSKKPIIQILDKLFFQIIFIRACTRHARVVVEGNCFKKCGFKEF